SAGIHLGRLLAPALGLAFAIAAANQRLLDEAIPDLHVQRGAYVRRLARAALEGWNHGVPDLRWGPFYLRGSPTGTPGVRRNALVVAEEEGFLAEAEAARLTVEGDELVAVLSKPRVLLPADKEGTRAFSELD